MTNYLIINDGNETVFTGEATEQQWRESLGTFTPSEEVYSLTRLSVSEQFGLATIRGFRAYRGKFGTYGPIQEGPVNLVFDERCTNFLKQILDKAQAGR